MRRISRLWLNLAAVCVPLLIVFGTASQSARGQFGLGFGNRIGGVVGGVSVDSDGVLRTATEQEKSGILDEMRRSVRQPAAGLAEKTELRMISLGKLQAEIQSAIAEGRDLSEDVLFLAGLQRIEYVFVYPEQNDIVLAGPAEGWQVRDDASVVGVTTGKPVIQLEDLITALRSAEETRQAPMSVSIDPTPEGEVNLRKFLAQVRIGPGFNPARIEPAMREAFGPQMVSLTSIAKDSRMASTLVAADYRMKRLAMNLEDAPVGGLPSYMEMIRNGGATQKTQPRWWIACDYDALLHSQDLLAWKLTGRGVKAMTEEEIVAASGQRTQTGKVNQTAQRWADLFTEKFDELCSTNSAFGDLRNVMDLNVVAAVIVAHDLQGSAGCDLSLLFGEAGNLETPTWKSPEQIAPECSFVRGRSGWIVSASGGVEINPWRIVSQDSKLEPKVQFVRAKSVPRGGDWWWN